MDLPICATVWNIDLIRDPGLQSGLIVSFSQGNTLALPGV